MQLLAFVLIYPFLWVVSILPHRLFYGLSDIACFFIYRVFGYRRKVVQENLNLVFPDKSADEIQLGFVTDLAPLTDITTLLPICCTRHSVNAP